LGHDLHAIWKRDFGSRHICDKERVMSRCLWIIVLLSLLSPAIARDVGQWENTDPVIHQWYKTLMRPDAPDASCCTEADAYWADDFFVRDGKMYARITDDRPDEPLGRPHIENGTVFLVPAEKMKWDRANPTGHGVLFVSVSGFTWCYVQGSGT
jgi:hypothetical protein